MDAADARHLATVMQLCAEMAQDIAQAATSAGAWGVAGAATVVASLAHQEAARARAGLDDDGDIRDERVPFLAVKAAR